ncbi:MAG: flagellar hook assembly protein FlgD [Opitutaceae bacterium]|nr:flagellar hook assembly protein FlgD [Opitutaceae bacterium]
MAVDATSSATNASAYAASTDTGRTVKKALGQEDFFELLATQLANQDPLSPMENTEYIAQMASFSTLESMSSLASSFSAFSAQQGFMTMQSVLGREVTVQDGDNTVSGIATAVHVTDGTTQVTIDGTDYPAMNILRVEVAG